MKDGTHPAGAANAKPFEPSLRLRFAGYATCLLFSLTACALVLLVATGAFDPVRRNIEQAIDHQLENSLDLITRNIDVAAANGMILSRQLSHLMDSFLSRNGLAFDDLRDSQERLEALQSEAYDLLAMSARTAPCSGAFFILNTTVNSSLETPTSSGLYLKYANVNAENTAANRLCLYRGSYTVARDKGINLHSSWQLETERNTFPAWEKAASSNGVDLASEYFLSETYDLPGSWESARFVCLPVTDAQGQVVGACGFEITDLYFQLAYRTPDGPYGRTVCILLDKADPTARGCLAGSQSGYLPASSGTFSVAPDEDFIRVDTDVASYVGKMSALSKGNGTHEVVVALPDSLYESVLSEGRTKATVSLLVILALALGLSWYLGKRYLKPVTKHLDSLRSEAEAERTRAQNKLDSLTDKRKPEINPCDYQAFLEGQRTLTPKERSIVNLIAQGYSNDDIMRMADIGRNTLKYHNRNIYTKLGVSSRKQLLLYLQVQQQNPDSKGTALR